jgi:regulator of sigma E protease
MLGILWTLGSFLLAFSILVAVHEYGHFWVARRCGIKVETFSIGFGKTLFEWKDRLGTTYIIAAIPLGGYVKMLDERVEAVDEADKPYAFNRKSVWKRSAVVAAGPLANFVFAVFIYWILAIIGTTVMKPVVTGTKAVSLSSHIDIDTPHVITQVAEKRVQSYQDVNFALIGHLGQPQLTLTLAPLQDPDQTRQVTINTANWRLPEHQRGLVLESLGIEPYQAHIDMHLAQVAKGSAADQAGLKVGDQVLAVNEQNVDRWTDLVQRIERAPMQPLNLLILRGNERLTVLVTPERVLRDGIAIGRLGIAPTLLPIPESMRTTIRYGVWDSFRVALEKTQAFIAMTVTTIGNLFTGHVSVTQLGGPIAIAQGAGQSASAGWYTFLYFLFFFSVNLGVINLLPLPILDGGHLLYNVLEIIRGKPLSEHIQAIGYRLSGIMLIGLMLLTLFNDLARI